MKKTKKALQKRFSVTKTGKVLKRHAGQDHFNSRDSGKITRKKRRDHEVSESNQRTIKRLTNC
ncbi:MAG: 50S ribosomal protein L35 [Parcubacteria group bacterium]|nr:50S ribosomal protein L35 [Parcubacteria group bacterium]